MDYWKLIELLNEYQKGLNEKEENKKHSEIYERRAGVCDIYMNDLDDPYEWLNMYWWYAKARLISKQFWFIKWLVDNDKIDYSKLVEYEFDELERFIQRKHNALLMLLSIQGNPIDFLISILK